MTDWCPNLTASDAPRYIAIADCIESDLNTGRLSAGDRLPAQRQLARQLGLDYTTVARGYAEANRRGIIFSQVGSGTFVTKPEQPAESLELESDPRRICLPDHSMNLPPEPDISDLIGQMQVGLAALTADLVPLLRYQTFEVSEPDLQAACNWLENTGLIPNPEQIVIAPGAQAALSAIVSLLTERGDTVLCETITYPGIRSICAQQDVTLEGLLTDDDGIDPIAFEIACKRSAPKALYLNPTLSNPTTRTIPEQRRLELVAIAQRYGVAILEDDAYGRLSSKAVHPFAAIAPDICWHIASLSKTIGAGLRLAYVIAPRKKSAWQLSRSLRTTNVMASPLTVALATRWIEDGTAQALLTFIRSESATRQDIARKQLAGQQFTADPDGFHLWLELGKGWSRSSFVSQMRSHALGIVESDAFTVDVQAPEAVRICLGGPLSRDDLANALETITHTLDESPERVSAYF